MKLQPLEFEGTDPGKQWNPWKENNFSLGLGWWVNLMWVQLLLMVDDKETKKTYGNAR